MTLRSVAFWSPTGSRPRTLRFYEILRLVADTENVEDCIGDDKGFQRQQLGVLRRIFAGGLMTPERYARHKRLPCDRLCPCGDDKETVFHVSWYCSRYAHLRMEVLDSFSDLGISLDSLPVCFTYAGIVPTGFFLNDELIERVHRMLVAIWQENIKSWYAGKDLSEQVSKAHPERTMVGDLISENGHLLAPRAPLEGMYCKLCGKYVSRMQHVRLKITSRRCKNEGGPLLSSEGFHHNDNRLDFLERQLNLKYNSGKHLLKWNRKTGKSIGAEDEGMIQCLRCGRFWRWKDRVQNLPRTKCLGRQTVSLPRRVSGKQPLSHILSLNSPVHAAQNEASSSSNSVPFDRMGIG